jgi:hypothetical protein
LVRRATFLLSISQKWCAGEESNFRLRVIGSGLCH